MYEYLSAGERKKHIDRGKDIRIIDVSAETLLPLSHTLYLYLLPLSYTLYLSLLPLSPTPSLSLSLSSSLSNTLYLSLSLLLISIYHTLFLSIYVFFSLSIFHKLFSLTISINRFITCTLSSSVSHTIYSCFVIVLLSFLLLFYNYFHIYCILTQ